jgi:hypothetical protein
MKQLLLPIAFVLSTLAATAQIRLGVQAGLSTTYTSLTEAKNLSSFSFIQPGIIFEVPLLKNLINFRPQFNYLKTGYTANLYPTVANALVDSIKRVSCTDNINIPLDIAYPIKMGKAKLVVYAGPVINIGVNGVTTITSINKVPSIPNTSDKIDFGTSAANIKGVNWGGNFGLGYQTKRGLELRANINPGFTNLSNITTQQLKHNIVSIMLAYYLKK